MSKHTEGPWRLAEMHAQGLYMNDGAAAVLAESGRVALVDIQSKAKRGQGYQAKCPERDANARLIAAAPDPLAACKLAMQFWYSDQPNDTAESVAAKHAIREAIAKAEVQPSAPKQHPEAQR